MPDQIPTDLGKGTKVQLARHPAPVNIGHTDQLGSAVVMGANLASPIGPMVVVGVSALAPDQARATVMMAHLEPDDAIALAAQLLLAASTVQEYRATVRQ